MLHQSRRDFGVSCARAAVAAVAGKLFRGEGRGEAQRKRVSPGKYVDVHTHLGQTWNTTVELTASNLLKWMDGHDVAQAVVLPLVSPESSSYLLTTDFVLAQTRAHRDRLIPFCCIDPRTAYSG